MIFVIWVCNNKIITLFCFSYTRLYTIYILILIPGVF